MHFRLTPKMKWALLAASAGAALVLAGVSALIFQDNLARFAINPRTPFQIATPPPPPEYAARGAWILWPDRGGDGAADIFYVHSTTFYSDEGWNAPVTDPEADEALRRIAAPNEAGPFAGLGPIYGPRYRQATLFAFFTHKFDGVAARQLAYGDVRRAFEHFLAATDGKRPIILVGYGQGGLHVQGILQEFFQDEALRLRLAAAYVIGQATPLPLFDGALARTPPCEKPTDFRCVISYTDFEHQFDEEMERTRERSLVWSPDGELVPTGGAPLLCINPITWTATPDYAEPDGNLGAASATGLRFGATPPAVTKAVGAQCVNGVLQVDSPVQEYLRRDNWFGAKWRAQHFNLFYFDLAEDARRRAENTAAELEKEYRFLDPIEESVDLEISPVNKVPD